MRKEEQNGEYNVKIGSKVLICVQSECGCQRLEGDFCSFWKIRERPKANNLLWMICRSCLPTQV